MTEKDLRERLVTIEQYAQAGDHEAAHVKEDELFKDVLIAIALDPYNAKTLAFLALKSRAIEFRRWCS